MHTYTTYDLPSKADNEALALADCKEYMGDRYESCMELLRAEVAASNMRRTELYRGIAHCCWFAGIEGYYPVRAMVREVLK